MKVDDFVCTYCGGAAHRWQRLSGKGSEAGDSSRSFMALE